MPLQAVKFASFLQIRNQDNATGSHRTSRCARFFKQLRCPDEGSTKLRSTPPRLEFVDLPLGQGSAVTRTAGGPLLKTQHRSQAPVEMLNRHRITGWTPFITAASAGLRLAPQTLATHAGAGVQKQNPLASTFLGWCSVRRTLQKRTRESQASRLRTRQRSRSSQRFSIRLRRVTRVVSAGKTFRVLEGNFLLRRAPG